MSKRIILFFLSTILLIILIELVINKRIKHQYKEENIAWKIFHTSANKYMVLSDKYEQRLYIDKTIEALQKIAKAKKVNKNTGLIILEFEQLTASVLDKIWLKVLHSSLQVKKIIIIRKNEKFVSLHLEIVR